MTTFFSNITVIKPALVLALFFISPVGFSIAGEPPNTTSSSSHSSEVEIGNSYFKFPRTRGEAIRQIGVASEYFDHQFFDVYLFLNELFKNNVYGEIRAYYISHVLNQKPISLSGRPLPIPLSSERPVLGTGTVGILGYNIDLTSTWSILPFTRLQFLTNNTVAYKDTFGNKIESDNYTAFLGAKVSKKITEVFALYASFYMGYQRSILYGSGIFLNTNKPGVNATVSTFELGAPYKYHKVWNFTPYIQFITPRARPNPAARVEPLNLRSDFSTHTLYAFKASYVF